MVSKQSNHGLRVISSSSADTDSDPKGDTLAQTPFGGQARLNELERLVKTARRVRKYAEQDVAESRTSREVAEQRIATCERTLRKAEDEMARIRSELYRAQQQAGAEARNYQSAEEFELAILLGKAARAEEPSDEDIAALELTPVPKADKRKTTRRAEPAPFRGISREQHKTIDGSGRRLGFALLVTIGAAVGATLTYLALTTPSIKEDVKSIATDPVRLTDEPTAGEVTQRELPSAPAVPEAPTAAIPAVEPEQQLTDNTTKPTSESGPESSIVRRNTDPFEVRAKDAQLTKVLKDAERDFECAQNDRLLAPDRKSQTAEPSANPTLRSDDSAITAKIPSAHQPRLEVPKSRALIP